MRRLIVPSLTGFASYGLGRGGAAATDLRSSLLARLKGDAILAGLVPAAAIRHGYSAQRDAEPRVVVQVLSNPRGQQLSGCAGYAKARVQVSIRAATTAEAVAIKARVEGLLDGFRGVLPGGLRVTDCHQLGESDLYDWPDDGKGRPLCGVRVDYRVRHNVRAPAT
ncbi:MAG: DUF3168 domain-containing protein [Isosphaeraceae bacterium]